MWCLGIFYVVYWLGPHQYHLSKESNAYKLTILTGWLSSWPHKTLSPVSSASDNRRRWMWLSLMPHTSQSRNMSFRVPPKLHCWASARSSVRYVATNSSGPHMKLVVLDYDGLLWAVVRCQNIHQLGEGFITGLHRRNRTAQ